MLIITLTACYCQHIYPEPEWNLSHGVTVAEAALLEFFKRMRPGDPATLDNAREFLEEQLFDQRHYDLERLGVISSTRNWIYTIECALPTGRSLNGISFAWFGA